MSAFKVGDTVKVEFEGKVTFVHDDGYLTLEEGDLAGEIVRPEHAVKIEPPVTVFKPGDVLREKGVHSDDLILLGRDGHTFFRSGKHYPHLPEGPWSLGWFTSENFERVELHESPL